jgi:cytochrome c-type biogenesis protein CcmH/NrfG
VQTAVRLPRRTVRLSLAGTALLVAAGALWLLVRPAPHAMRAAGEGALSLPDAPSPQEQALLRALVTARPGDPEPGRALGDFYASGSRPFEALWAYSFALRAEPDGASVNLGLARAMETALLYDAAIARLRAVLAREPGQREAVERLAELYLRTGRPEAALAAARGAGFLATHDGAVMEGRAREALGDAGGAEQAYRRALEQDAGDAATRHRLGLLALSRGRRSDALQALQQAHSLDPSDPRYATDLGRVLAASSDPRDRQAAMQLFRAAVHDRPYAPAYYQSGLLLAAAKRLPEAAEGFTRATATRREFADAHRELARVLEVLGRRAEAHYHRGLYFSIKDLRSRSLREYLAMAAADPARPDGLLMASQSHFKMVQKAQSVARARQALAEHPQDPRARELLAASLIVIHDRKGAAKVCQE